MNGCRWQLLQAELLPLLDRDADKQDRPALNVTGDLWSAVTASPLS